MLSKFAGKSMLYTLGAVVTRGFAFFLLPLYTRYLSPADYGVLALSASFATILGMLLAFSLESAVIVFYFQLEADEYRKLVRAIWLYLSVVPLLAVGALLLLGPLGSPLLFPSVPWNPYLRLAVWIAYTNILVTVPLALLRAQQRAAEYVCFTLAMFGITTSLTIYFVVLRGEGARGSLNAQLLSGIVMAASAHWIVVRYCWSGGGTWFHRRHLLSALRFCLPFLPHILCIWLLNLSDRWILAQYVSLGELGIYNLAYTMGSVLGVLGWGLICAYEPLYYQSHNDSSLGLQIPRMLTGYMLVMTWVTLALSLSASEALQLVTQPAFYGAAKLVPWIAAGFWCFGGLYPVAMLAVEYHRRTKWNLFISGPAALANVGLNWLLIPRYGVQAAALATLAGFALMTVLALRFSGTLERLVVPWLVLVRMVMISIVVYLIGSTWLSLPDLALAILAKGSLLVLTGIAMASLGGFRLNNLGSLLSARRIQEAMR